ncbi:unnamed protein product [Angiostrongylus costaricensis]|uniref:Ovule protein n=1 Tax=Angiostrongylus costaricensis TaxID=334426 RepID=A0A0R3P9H2_ANGCS|nr:unnamed protein product [Angiostrongylus costaricensis]
MLRYSQNFRLQVSAEGNERVIPFLGVNAFTTTPCASFVSPLSLSFVFFSFSYSLTFIPLNASKPSLFSSHWSIHAQIQNSDQLDVDVKNCSKSSLPDAFELKSYSLRGTKSLSGILSR